MWKCLGEGNPLVGLGRVIWASKSGTHDITWQEDMVKEKEEKKKKKSVAALHVRYFPKPKRHKSQQPTT